MCESVLGAGGRRAGSLGTISVRWPGFEEKAAMTTPESLDLQRWLARMRDARVEAVALEVSSHSLALGRVRGLRFAVAVFTQLAHDHLDFHGDLESYGRAKALLFEPELLAGTAVLNVADPWTRRLAKLARVRREPGRHVRARRAERRRLHHARRADRALALAPARARAGRRARARCCPLPGDFQVDNALGRARASGARSGCRGTTSCAGSRPARRCRDGSSAWAARRPIVLVDYAHTPNSLERMLARRAAAGARPS